MEAQMTHDHHRYEEDPHHNAALHSVMAGEGEAEHNHHGEKKSVLKKVKDKAKKIKNTITKHAGHDHEHDVDGDEDEETVVASDVHGGAPMVSEGDFISGTALPKQTGLKLGNESSPPPPPPPLMGRQEVYDDVENVGVPMALDRHSPNIRRNEVGDDEVMKNSAPLMEDIPKIGKEEHYSSGGIGDVGAMEDPYIPSIRKAEYYSGGVGDDDRGEMGRQPVDAPMTTDLLDPLPASRGPIEPERRANVAEPVVKIGPLEDLEKDPHAPGGRTPPPNYQSKVVDPTGQGGREAEVAPLIERLGNLSVGDKSESIPPVTGSHDQFNPPESLQGKSVTSVIADKAASAKNAVASSLGYGNQQGQEPASSKTTALGTVSQYGHIVAEKLKAAAGAGAGAGVVKEESSDKGVSVQGYLAEKFTPGEEDKELSKVITDAINRKKKEEQPQPVKETVRIEAVCSDEKTAAGVVDRVKGAIGSWLGGRGQQQGEGLDKEEVSRLQESRN